MEMTRDELKTLADKVFDEILNAHGETLGYLKARWQDEREYEDWAEYEKVIRQKLTGYNVVKVIKVGAVIRTKHFDLQIKVNMESATWKIVKLHDVKIAA